MVSLRQLFLFSLLFSKNLGAFEVKELRADVTDVILTWPVLYTERLIDLDAVASEQPILPDLKRARAESDIVPLDFEVSRRLRQEFCEGKNDKCKLCTKKLYPQTFAVLQHYKFNSFVLGLESSAKEHFDMSAKKHFDRVAQVCAKPEYTDTVAHFARRVKKEGLAQNIRKSKK